MASVGFRFEVWSAERCIAVKGSVLAEGQGQN